MTSFVSGVLILCLEAAPLVGGSLLAIGIAALAAGRPSHPR
jgi:hypothetical protein